MKSLKMPVVKNNCLICGIYDQLVIWFFTTGLKPLDGRKSATVIQLAFWFFTTDYASRKEQDFY